jgi:hypothetical protein
MISYTQKAKICEQKENNNWTRNANCLIQRLSLLVEGKFGAILSTAIRKRTKVPHRDRMRRIAVQTLGNEIRTFRQRKSDERDIARQMVALRLSVGIDLDTALLAGGKEKTRMILRLERRLEQERLRGMRRHWSYDLNRHISLKQALDLLRAPGNPRK